MMLLAAHPLATVNAVLNGIATLLLILGYILIRQRKEQAHKWTMLTAFLVSVVFLICYLAYHVWPVGAKSVPFSGPSEFKSAYLLMLFSHIVLAALVPALALRTIYLGLKNDRPRHSWWAKRTFPIWLYVSVTGVMIYLILYVIYPAAPT